MAAAMPKSIPKIDLELVLLTVGLGVGIRYLVKNYIA